MATLSPRQEILNDFNESKRAIRDNFLKNRAKLNEQLLTQKQNWETYQQELEKRFGTEFQEKYGEELKQIQEVWNNITQEEANKILQGNLGALDRLKSLNEQRQRQIDFSSTEGAKELVRRNISNIEKQKKTEYDKAVTKTEEFTKTEDWKNKLDTRWDKEVKEDWDKLETKKTELEKKYQQEAESKWNQSEYKRLQERKAELEYDYKREIADLEEQRDLALAVLSGKTITKTYTDTKTGKTTTITAPEIKFKEAEKAYFQEKAKGNIYDKLDLTIGKNTKGKYEINLSGQTKTLQTTTPKQESLNLKTPTGQIIPMVYKPEIQQGLATGQLTFNDLQNQKVNTQGLLLASAPQEITETTTQTYTPIINYDENRNLIIKKKSEEGYELTPEDIINIRDQISQQINQEEQKRKSMERLTDIPIISEVNRRLQSGFREISEDTMRNLGLVEGSTIWDKENNTLLQVGRTGAGMLALIPVTIASGMGNIAEDAMTWYNKDGTPKLPLQNTITGIGTSLYDLSPIGISAIDKIAYPEQTTNFKLYPYDVAGVKLPFEHFGKHIVEKPIERIPEAIGNIILFKALGKGTKYGINKTINLKKNIKGKTNIKTNPNKTRIENIKITYKKALDTYVKKINKELNKGKSLQEAQEILYRNYLKSPKGKRLQAKIELNKDIKQATINAMKEDLRRQKISQTLKKNAEQKRLDVTKLKEMEADLAQKQIEKTNVRDNRIRKLKDQYNKEMWGQNRLEVRQQIRNQIREIENEIIQNKERANLINELRQDITKAKEQIKTNKLNKEYESEIAQLMEKNKVPEIKQVLNKAKEQQVQEYFRKAKEKNSIQKDIEQIKANEYAKSQAKIKAKSDLLEKQRIKQETANKLREIEEYAKKEEIALKEKGLDLQQLAEAKRLKNQAKKDYWKPKTEEPTGGQQLMQTTTGQQVVINNPITKTIEKTITKEITKQKTKPKIKLNVEKITNEVTKELNKKRIRNINRNEIKTQVKQRINLKLEELLLIRTKQKQESAQFQAIGITDLQNQKQNQKQNQNQLITDATTQSVTTNQTDVTIPTDTITTIQIQWQGQPYPMPELTQEITLPELITMPKTTTKPPSKPENKKQKKPTTKYTPILLYGQTQIPTNLTYSNWFDAQEAGAYLTDTTPYKRFEIQKVQSEQESAKLKYNREVLKRKFLNMPYGRIQEKKKYWKDHPQEQQSGNILKQYYKMRNQNARF